VSYEFENTRGVPWAAGTVHETRFPLGPRVWVEIVVEDRRPGVARVVMRGPDAKVDRLFRKHHLLALARALEDAAEIAGELPEGINIEALGRLSDT